MSWKIEVLQKYWIRFISHDIESGLFSQFFAIRSEEICDKYPKMLGKIAIISVLLGVVLGFNIPGRKYRIDLYFAKKVYLQVMFR